MQMENEKNCWILQTHNPPTQQAQSIALLQIIVIFLQMLKPEAVIQNCLLSLSKDRIYSNSARQRRVAPLLNYFT